MFATTRNTASMILGVAFVAAAASTAPAFAGEPSLSQNEHASQGAIVGTVENLPQSVDASAATLARNEDLARQVIVDTSAPVSHRVDATGVATPTQNEIAAQRSIVDTAASDRFARYSGKTNKRVASMRSSATP
jgi:hypothetical protein